MKWVSVSERLPPDEFVYLKGYNRSNVGKIFLETNQGKSFIVFYVETMFSGGLEKVTSYTPLHEELKNIFWLDETE